MERHTTINNRKEPHSDSPSSNIRNHHGLMHNYLYKLFENYKLSSILLIFISFFIVWSAILCSLLIIQSISSTSTWMENHKIYEAHEKTSSITMNLDDMMLFIIESKGDNQTTGVFNKRLSSFASNELIIDFNTTVDIDNNSPLLHRLRLEYQILTKFYEEINNSIDGIIVRYQRWLPNDSHIIDDLRTAKDRFSSIYNQIIDDWQQQYDPIDTVTSFLELTELIERSCLSLDAPIHNINARHHHPINNIGLALYMKWMSRRTAQYALGFIYFQSNRHINVSHFLELHHTSLESLQVALQLEPKIQIKYWEAHKHLNPQVVASFNNLIDAMITNHNSRNDVSLKKAFREYTLLEYSISIILRKHYLKSLEDNITYCYDSYKKKLVYHVGIAMIALFGIGMCLFTVFLKVFFSKESRYSEENLSRLSSEREFCQRYGISRNDYIVNNHSESIKATRLSTRLQDLTYCPQDIRTIGNHIRNCQDGYLI